MSSAVRSACNAEDASLGYMLDGKIPWRRAWQASMFMEVVAGSWLVCKLCGDNSKTTQFEQTHQDQKKAS